MGNLPASRNTDYAALVPVEVDDLNDFQDQFIALYAGGAFEFKFVGFRIENPAPIFSSKTLDTSSEETSATGCAWSPDGLNFYIVGNANASVEQYTATVRWDTDTLSYASKSMDVSSEEAAPEGLAFSPDGTKAYIGGPTTDNVFQYTLTTPFDVSTGSYSGKSADVSDSSFLIKDLQLSPDGTKFYIIEPSSDRVYQYTMSTPFDVSTAGTTNGNLDVTSESTSPTGFQFNDDGTKAYILSFSDARIYQYTLTTPYVVTSGVSYDSVFASVSESLNPETFVFSQDGTKFYIVDSGSPDVMRQFYSLKSTRDEYEVIP